MTIHVQCDECFREYNVKDEYAGRKIRCKDCESSITIPTAAQKSRPKSKKKSESKNQKKSHDKSSGKLISLIVAFVLIIVMGGGLFFYMSGSAERTLYANLVLTEEKAKELEQQKKYKQAIEQFKNINSQVSNFEAPSDRLTVLQANSSNSIKECNKLLAQEEIVARQEADLKLIAPVASEIHELCKSKKHLKAFNLFREFTDKTNELENQSDKTKDLTKQTKEKIIALFEDWVKEQNDIAEKQISIDQYEKAASVYKSILDQSRLLGEITSSLKIMKTIEDRNVMNERYLRITKLIDSSSFQKAISHAENNPDNDPKLQVLLAAARDKLNQKIEEEKIQEFLTPFGRQLPLSKDFAKKFIEMEKTTSSMLELAKWCRDNNLNMEAEECLRAILVSNPNLEEAKQLYRETATSELTLTQAHPLEKLQGAILDWGVNIKPPEDHVFVVVPVHINFNKKEAILNKDSVHGKTGGKPATFMGVYHTPGKNNNTPTEPVNGTNTEGKKNIKSKSKKQISSKIMRPIIWEEVIVKQDEKETLTVEFKNKRNPILKSKSTKKKKSKQKKKNPKKNSSSGNMTKYKSASTSYKELGGGAYSLLFTVPKDETLKQISYENEESFRPMPDIPYKFLVKIAFNEEAPVEDRIQAIKLLHSKYDDSVLKDLVQLLKAENDDVYFSARNTIQKVRYKYNLVNTRFLLTPEKHAILSLNNFRILSKRKLRKGTLIIANLKQPSRIYKTVFRIDQPGDILCRVYRISKKRASRSSKNGGGTFRLVQNSILELPRRIPKPGIYSLNYISNASTGIPVVQLWQGNKLIDLKFFTTEVEEQNAINVHIPLIPPNNLDQKFPDTTPQPIATVDQNLSESQLVAAPYFHTVLPKDKSNNIPDLLEQVEQLESADPLIANKAETEITNLLQDKSPNLFVELSQLGSLKTRRKMMLETLPRLAKTEADICFFLLSSQYSKNKEQRQLAKTSLNTLYKTGVIHTTIWNSKKKFVRDFNDSGKLKERRVGGQRVYSFHGIFVPIK